MPRIKDRYHDIMRSLLATNFNAARLFPLIEAMAATIRPAVANDQMVSLPQFEAALSTLNPGMAAVDNTGGFRRGPGGPPRSRTAIKYFINRRVESARLQLEGKSEGYLPREMRPGPNGPRPAGPPP
jgi:hypothetical protein